jgi:HEAT repeat protein
MRTLVSFVLQAGLLWGGLTTADAVEQPNNKGTPATRAWNILTDGVNAKKFGDRMMALKALADLGPNVKGVQLVAGMLKDDDPDIRAQAAATLGEMKSRTAIRPLHSALGDEAPQVSFAAAKSLWQLGDTTGKRVLLEVLEGEKPTKDGFVAGQMRAMRRRFGDKKELASLGATETAGALLPGPLGMGVGLTKKGLAGSTNLARADCATLLSRRPDRETLLALKAALVDRDWMVRASAAKAIGVLGRPDTRKWLEFSLTDGKPAVRYEAAVAILRITSRAKTPAYAKLP